MLVSILLLFFVAMYSIARAEVEYCYPGDECFPSIDELNRFNASVNGHLIKTIPYGAVCYKDTYNAKACKTLVMQQNISEFRLSLPAGLMYTNWEHDGIEGCTVPALPEDGSAPIPITKGTCTLGGMSWYVVNASCTDEVATTVKFAAEKKLRFRIKNTGHDYTGRSSGVGTFAIWTHHLNDMQFMSDFEVCGKDYQTVISAGPGVTVEELYAFGAKNKVVTVGGFCPSVGATGGFLLGGGTGPLSSKLGLGVDNVIQFEVITANGQKKIANKCTEPDLFWALRGGGGAFGVVTRVWLKAYEQPIAVNWLVAEVECKDKDSFSNLVNKMVDIQLDLRLNGQTGSIWATSTKQLGMIILSVAPTWDSRPPANSSLDAYSPVLKVPNCLAKPTIGTSKQFNDAYRNALLPIIKLEAPLGSNVIDQSRLISYDIMNDPTRLAAVKDFITNLHPDLQFLWQNANGGAVRHTAGNATAVNPAWRNAFAFMNTPSFGPTSGITEEQKQLAIKALEDATRVFGRDAYYNEDTDLEADPFESFFGANYGRLKEIKERVDPGRVFNCRLCVGSEDGY